MKRILTALTLSALLASPAWAREYYVHPYPDRVVKEGRVIGTFVKHEDTNPMALIVYDDEVWMCRWRGLEYYCMLTTVNRDPYGDPKPWVRRN